MHQRRLDMMYGTLQLKSPWMSSEWRLLAGDTVVADIRRTARTYVSVVDIAGGGRLLIEPHGVGVVRTLDVTNGIDGAEEVGRIVRRSWVGRHWEILGHRYSYDLVSDRRPRRWHLSVANAPVATLAGSMLSYNKVKLDNSLGMPVSAVLMAWHVVARPWEAAAEPRGLIPVKAPNRA